MTSTQFKRKADWMKEAAYLVDRNARRIRFKTDSKLHKFIGWLLYPINKRYMKGYVTSFFGKIWFPSLQHLEDGLRYNPLGVYATIKHELKHLDDERRFPVFFHLSYLLLNLLIFIGPGFRAFWEWRGYKETLRAKYELAGEQGIHVLEQERIIRQFTSSNYGWMWPFKKRMERKVKRFLQELKDGN